MARADYSSSPEPTEKQKVFRDLYNGGYVSSAEGVFHVPTGRAQRRIDTSKDTGPAFDKHTPWFGRTRRDDPEELPAAARETLVETDFAEIEARVMAHLAQQRHPVTGLTHAQTERLAMLGEECGEIVQLVGKIARFGLDSRHPEGGPTNRELLIGELQDLLAVLTLMNRDDLDQSFENIEAPQAKIDRKKSYSYFQR